MKAGAPLSCREHTGEDGYCAGRPFPRVSAMLSRPPRRGRSELGRASGSEGDVRSVQNGTDTNKHLSSTAIYSEVVKHYAKEAGTPWRPSGRTRYARPPPRTPWSTGRTSPRCRNGSGIRALRPPGFTTSDTRGRRIQPRSMLLTDKDQGVPN